MKKTLLVAFVAMLSLAAMAAQAPTNAKAAAKGPSKHFPVTLAPPHACTYSKAHPCVYYGGDLNLSDPNQNGLSNENSTFIPASYTYAMIKSPVNATIHGSFSNNLKDYANDPAKCTWQYRKGMSEGNGGTLVASGDSACIATATGRNDFGFNEEEDLTATTVNVPAGNFWFSVTPDCTNASDSNCSSGTRSFGTNTDGTLNAINGAFSVMSAPPCPGGSTFVGPAWDSEVFFGVIFGNWCNDEGIGSDTSLPEAGGHTMSYGVLR